MMELTGKQKRYLRSKGHHLKPIFQVGKAGVNDNMVEQINDALEKRELLKVSVLQNCLEDTHIIAEKLARGTNAHIVQIIGHSILLYKRSENNVQIELP